MGRARGPARLLELDRIGEDATLTPSPLEGPFEVTSPLADGDRFGLELDVGGRPLRVLARRFRVVERGTKTRTVPAAFDRALRFRGPGPITIERMLSAIAAAAAASEGRLSGAVRVVPAGAAATDARGLWLVGHDLQPAGYVGIESTDATSFELLAAVVRGLGAFPGLTSAESGNRRLETAEERERWLAWMRGAR